MARVELAVNKITLDGLEVAAVAAAAGGNSFRNSGRMFLLVANAGASKVLTFQTPGEVGGLAIENPAVTVGAGKTKLIGPFPPLLFNQLSGVDIGKVFVDFDDVTGLTVEALQL